MRQFVFILFTGLASVPAAAQPFSESMADCAALHQNAAQWVQSERTAQQLMVAARAWAVAAVAQAKREERSIPEAAMWDKIDAKTADWEAKGAQAVRTKEFEDWTAYCRSFAQDQGIDTGL